MLDENKRREIAAHISMLECEESSWDNYARLAILRTLEQTERATPAPEASYSAAPDTSRAETYGDSEFLLLVSGKPSAEAWAVMNELMETLRSVNVKAYDRVMRRMREL